MQTCIVDQNWYVTPRHTISPNKSKKQTCKFQKSCNLKSYAQPNRSWTIITSGEAWERVKVNECSFVVNGRENSFIPLKLVIFLRRARRQLMANNSNIRQVLTEVLDIRSISQKSYRIPIPEIPYVCNAWRTSFRGGVLEHLFLYGVNDTSIQRIWSGSQKPSSLSKEAEKKRKRMKKDRIPVDFVFGC